MAASCIQRFTKRCTRKCTKSVIFFELSYISSIYCAIKSVNSPSVYIFAIKRLPKSGYELSKKHCRTLRGNIFLVCVVYCNRVKEQIIRVKQVTISNNFILRLPCLSDSIPAFLLRRGSTLPARIVHSLYRGSAFSQQG